jgi:hypothetical protein
MKEFGKEHDQTMNVEVVFDNKGKYEAAEAMHRQELGICEEVLGKEYSTRWRAYTVSLIFSQIGIATTNLPSYKRSCSGYRAVLRKDYPTTRACRQHRAGMRT